MKPNANRWLFVLLPVLLLVLSSMPATAEHFDNKGRDFLLTFLPNMDFSSHPIKETELHLTSDIPIDSVHVEYPANSPTFQTTVNLTPGNVTIVEIPLSSSNGWVGDMAEDHAVHVFANQEFICYMINRESFTTDAALALPIDVMNTEYIVINYNGTDLHCSDGGEFAIAAAYDNTQVTITPTKELNGGHTAGTSYSITLNAGQCYLGTSVGCSGTEADLTGTLISANKPIGMTNGNKCANIPPEIAACDHIFEVAQPVQTWGNSALVSNLPNRPNGTIYRVVSAQDNTDIYLDGSYLTTLDKGQFYETSQIVNSHVFSSNDPEKRIFVVQFMPGIGNPNATLGDPAMGNMTPAEQYLSHYTFSTIGGGQFTSHFLSIIAHNDDVGFLTLDGTPIAAGEYTPIPTTDYSSAVLQLTEGPHVTNSPNQMHMITVEGYASADSYIYPGGALFAPIPSTDTIPPLVTFEEDDCMVHGLAVDQGDTISGINQIFLDTSSFNLVLTIDPYTPGDLSATFDVALIDPSLDGFGGVFVFDLQGNRAFSEIYIEACEGGGEEIIPTNEWINIYCGNPTLNGEPLSPGDTIRAYDPDGVLCGMDVVRADGKFGLMPIYRDDTYTPDIDEGCQPGDVVQFTINGQEAYPDPIVLWTSNGNNYEVCEFTDCHIIHLKEGWNLISWNKKYFADIEDFVAKLSQSGDVPNCLNFIQAFDQGGLTYDPLFPKFSTLHSVDYIHGYWLNMNCDTDLEICGPKIPNIEFFDVYEGWNLVSYWPDEPLPVEDALESILNCVIVVLGWDPIIGGQTWVGSLKSFSTLEEMSPYYGYWIKSTCNYHLIYPGWSGLPKAVASGYDKSYQPEFPQSREWISLYGENLKLDGNSINAGAVIKAYTQNGQLCGKGIYDGNILKFTPVYGYDNDDESSTLPRTGDNIIVFIDDCQTYPDVSWTENGDIVDISSRFSSRSGAGVVPKTIRLDQNYPNPFNPTTTINFYLEDNMNIKLEVFNVVGQRVAILADGYYSSGEHQVVWNAHSEAGSEVASGVYFYRLTGDNTTEIRKMSLTR